MSVFRYQVYQASIQECLLTSQVACQAIQHEFLKPSLVNLISKDVNLVFYLSVYQDDLLFKLANMA